MSGKAAGGTSWGAVALGWVAAAVVGAVISPLLRLLYGVLAGPPVERGEFTTAIVVISVVSGFLAYLAGGYVAARTAGHAGGTHGALTAVFGLVFGLVLAGILGLFGVLFTEGVAMPPAGFGLASAALAAGLILFLVDLFGGYVGGKLGEPPETESLTGPNTREGGP